jgi:hydrogenase/urease accessory protein HupE
MVDKIAGLARLVATLLAIVAAFVPIIQINVALVLVILGLIAGLKYRPESTIVLLLVVIALPLVGAALANIPQIGARLNAVALNIELAAAAVAATVIAMRLYNNSREDLSAFASQTGGATPAAA